MNNTHFKLSYDDITVVPEIITDIKSRSECSILTNTQCGYDETGNGGRYMLPIFTAPMDTVVDENNFKEFLYKGIIPILPRTVDLVTRCRTAYMNNIFAALSIEETKKVYIEPEGWSDAQPEKLCIDLANGHMQQIPDLVKEIKTKYGDEVAVMVGNIANPETYRLYEEAGADYIRAGVGGGDACFLSGQKVRTEKGYVNIEDIRVGDKIYTHTGNIKEVINNFMYVNKNENILSINGIKCTENHRFYVIDKKYVDIVTDENIHDYAKWVNANKLEKNKYFLIELA